MLEDDDDATPLPEPEACAQGTIEGVRVAFQGEPGAFGEEAVHTLWGGAAEPVPVPTFEDVMDATASGRVDYGVMPIESTLVGGLDTTYDLLSLHDELCIVADVIVPVHLCLLALPGATLAGLRTVASHPVMLGQCSYFLERHRTIAPQPAWDTAGAAREVAESGDLTRAAAGTRRAAQRFGLEVLMEDIEDRADSQMRFLAVAREPAPPGAGVAARTALLLVLRQEAGALVHAVQPLADAGFSMSHLATRPTREPWRYQFFLEFEHPGADPRLPGVLAAVRRASAEYRLLGTYRRWPVPAPRSEDLMPW
jgi:prephenate dehydratase